MTIFLNVCLCSLLCFVQGLSHIEKNIPSNDLHRQDYSSDLRKLQLDCIAQTRVDPDEVLHLKSGYWAYKPDFALRDWILCLLVKAGLMTKQGVFLMDEALSKVPLNEKVTVQEKIDKCLYNIKRRGIPQNVAWLYVKCYNEEDPKKLLLL